MERHRRSVVMGVSDSGCVGDSPTVVMVKIPYCGNGSHGVLGGCDGYNEECGSGNHGVFNDDNGGGKCEECVAVLVMRMLMLTLARGKLDLIHKLQLPFVHGRERLGVCACTNQETKHPHYPSSQSYI